MSAWYEETFGRDYLTLYPHRNDDEAHRDVADIIRLIDPPRDQPLLDLCCGAGRHLVAFWKAGFRDLTGLDLSEDLLAEARSRLEAESTSGIHLVCADMRDIPATEAYHTIVSLFTSFGYFATDQEDTEVLCSAHQALIAGGTFLMDTLNRHSIIANLVQQEEKHVGGKRISVRRHVTRDGCRVEKDTLIRTKGEPETMYHESVRMYKKQELEGMLLAAGFSTPRFYGALDGRPYAEDSPRMVVAATKERKGP